MIAWFESLPPFAAGVLVVGSFIALTFLVGWIVARLTSHSVREQHNDLGGFILSVIGVVYAVLLAFVAISVWARFEAAQTRSYDEAEALQILYRDAASFPDVHALRASLRKYASIIIEDEWPKMAKGEDANRAQKLIGAIDDTIRSLPANSPARSNVQAQMLASMERSLRDRDERLSMDATGIDPLMWLVLLVGGVITVAFTFFLGFKEPIIQQLMIGSLALVIGLVLFLTIALDYPFRGGITVGPDAFRAAVASFRAMGP